MIQIQATFSGHAGAACTLFSAYDPATRVLAIGVEAAYREQRRDGCVVITNVAGIPRDSLFDMDHLRPAIEAFYALRSGVAADGVSSRLAFGERASRASPEQSIERDGIDSNGPKYRISPDITCAQMAALATCLHATKSHAISSAVSMAERLRALAEGSILTI